MTKRNSKQKNKLKGNGEGTIYYCKTRKILVGQYVVNGNRKSVYQRKKEKNVDFKKRFNKLLNDISLGMYIEKSTDTIESIAEEYINNKLLDGITNERSYRREIETLNALRKTCSNFCKKPIQKVTIKDITKAKALIREYSNSVIDKIWRLLEKTFEIACSPSRKILIYNIMKDNTLKKPISIKKTQRILALSNSEMNRLNDVLDNEERNHKYRNIVKMQIISGMRIGEVLARSKKDYNAETKEFNVHNTLTQDKNYNTILGKYTKTYNKKTQIDDGQRYLPLDNELFKEAVTIINEQCNNQIANIYDLMFWDYEGNSFITPSQINSWLSRINKKYNIVEGNLSTHRLRHSAITHWSEMHIPLTVIQYLAGHTQGSDITGEVYINTTLEYVNSTLKNVG